MSSETIPEWAMRQAEVCVFAFEGRIQSGEFEGLDPEGSDARDALKSTIAHALLAAEQRGEEKKAAEIEALLKDPVAVRANYLRGGIACQPLIDEAERRGLEKAAEVALIRSPDDDSLDWQVRQQVADAIRSLGDKT